MYRFIYQLNEIRQIFIRVRLIEMALDLIIIFLSGFLIFPYPASIWISIPVFVYLIIALKYKFKKKIVNIIEERYPALKERLSAAFDNKDEKNVVMEDLAASVLIDMEQVKYSSFISMKRLGARIIIILLLVTMVLSTSLVNSPINLAENENTRYTQTRQDLVGSSSGMDIFAEPSFVRIGNESEGVMVYRSSGSDQNLPGERKQVPVYSQLFPRQESQMASSRTYNEDVPMIYQQIVKNYFTNLSGS